MNNKETITIKKMTLVKLSIILVFIVIMIITITKGMGVGMSYDLQYVLDGELHTEIFNNITDRANRAVEVHRLGATVY